LHFFKRKSREEGAKREKGLARSRFSLSLFVPQFCPTLL
jgi:hypothetical protein